MAFVPRPVDAEPPRVGIAVRHLNRTVDDEGIGKPVAELPELLVPAEVGIAVPALVLLGSGKLGGHPDPRHQGVVRLLPSGGLPGRQPLVRVHWDVRQYGLVPPDLACRHAVVAVPYSPVAIHHYGRNGGFHPCILLRKGWIVVVPRFELLQGHLLEDVVPPCIQADQLLGVGPVLPLRVLGHDVVDDRLTADPVPGPGGDPGAPAQVFQPFYGNLGAVELPVHLEVAPPFQGYGDACGRGMIPQQGDDVLLLAEVQDFHVDFLPGGAPAPGEPVCGHPYRPLRRPRFEAEALGQQRMGVQLLGEGMQDAADHEASSLPEFLVACGDRRVGGRLGGVEIGVEDDFPLWVPHPDDILAALRLPYVLEQLPQGHPPALY